MLQRSITWGSVLLALASLSLWAVDRNGIPDHGSTHETQATNATHTNIPPTPTESGQSAFAALVEIVALLERNSGTDWKRVNIDQLRLHLLDMSRLVLDTEASTTTLNNRQIRINVEGSLDSIPAIHRMVPAHTSYIQQSRGWMIDTVLTDRGASVTISSDDAAILEMLNALGFYGFMSLDSHHQSHHLFMAMGQNH